MATPLKRLLLIGLLGIAVFAGFSIYADVSELGSRLRGFAWPGFAAAVGLALCNYAVRFVRWQLYLRMREIAVPPGLSLQVFLSGFALSVTPGKLGELIKCYFLKELRGTPVAQSAPLVVAERVTDLAALLILGLVGVALYGVGQHMVLAGLLLVGAGLLILAWPRVCRRLIELFTSPRFARRFRDRFLEFYGGLVSLVQPRPLSWATALAVIAWLAECVGFALILASFPGTAVPLGLAILIYSATTVAGALSFLPGGLLVTEAGMALMLVQSSRGVDEATAVAATILTRLATLWLAVVIGLLALAFLRRGHAVVSKALSAAPVE